MPAPKPRQDTKLSDNGFIGDWTPCARLDGSEYYTKNMVVHWLQTRGDDAPHIQSSLVVDHLHLRGTADAAKQTNVSCEEIYVSNKDKWLLVFHSSQTAFYTSQQFIDIRTKRKLYWEYISMHPSHTFISLANWLPEAHKLAQVYLQWCIFEALTSSEAKTPFPLKHSQDLSKILASLDERPEFGLPSTEQQSMLSLRHNEGSAASIEVLPEENEAGPAPQASGSSSSDSAVSIPGNQDNNNGSIDKASAREVNNSHNAPQVVSQPLVPPETAAQESCKLRTTLVARVLSRKYTQQGAVDGSKEIAQPLKPSKALDLLFWTVDVTSFGSFLRYLSRLEEVRAPILTDDKWRDHIMRLVKEWEEFNLISTVLLSASAGILALQNLGSIARTATLVSIICSFGSITTGLYCISMYQIRTPDSPDSLDRTNALTILAYNHYTLTHKGFALILGLPMAFLVWSLISFMVGILSFNIVGTETGSGHVSGVAYAVVSVTALIFLLTGVAFYTLARVWGTSRGLIIPESFRKWTPGFLRRKRLLSEKPEP